MSDDVSAMSQWNDRNPEEKVLAGHQGKIRGGKVLMSHNNQNALKVLCCQQVHMSSLTHTHTQVGWFSFNEYLRYCITRERPGCIKADSLSGSYFQLYFHDKHLFQIHHVLMRLSQSHVIPRKTISAAECIDTNWLWTLIILYNSNKLWGSWLFLWVRARKFSSHRPLVATDNAKKRQNGANVGSSELRYD